MSTVQVEKINLGGWEMNYTTQRRTITTSSVDQISQILKQWQRIFPKEYTWVQNTFCVPSLVVRIDCIIQDGKVFIFEIEDRPNGVGISFSIDNDFREKYQYYSRLLGIEDCKVVLSPQRSCGDDHLYLELTDKPNGSLVLVRAEPDEEQFHYLESQSISTLKAEGNKQYGVEFGWWKEISSLDQNDLDWANGFVLKPLQGSKCQNLEIWDPQRRQGSSTKTRVIKRLCENGKMYCQPLVSPMVSGIDGASEMIYRVFFVYDASSQEWKLLGGVWNARSNLKIHGAKDAIFGLVSTC